MPQTTEVMKPDGRGIKSGGEGPHKPGGWWVGGGVEEAWGRGYAASVPAGLSGRDWSWTPGGGVRPGGTDRAAV